MRRGHIACRYFGGSLAILCLLCAAELRAAPQAQLGDEALAHYDSLTLEDTFTAVATGIRYEPYDGVLRGPRGTALAHGGNAADQALLLAQLLRNKGYRVRFVFGTLSGKNLDTLIRGLYPPDAPALTAPEGFPPFDPSGDAELRRIGADHVWLELDQGDGSWLPLDPAFPRAKAGEAYAEAKSRADQLPDDLYRRIRISAHESYADGDERELGVVEGKIAELAMQPLSYVEVGGRLLQTQPKKAKPGAADMFGGALAGDTGQSAEEEKPFTPGPVGFQYTRAFRLSGQAIKVADTLILDAKPETAIGREWLRFELSGPGKERRVVERDIYARGAPGDEAKRPLYYRRYNIGILAGPLDPDAVTAYTRTAAKGLDAESLRRQADALAAGDANDPAIAQRATQLEERVGDLGGHLAALALGAEISALTRRIAFSNAVTYAQALPAVIIVSTEGEEGKAYEIGVDLRLDEVDAWPYPGGPTRLAEYFQSARGIQGTLAESLFVQKIAGKSEGANAFTLLTDVEQSAAGWLVFEHGEENQLDQVEGLTPYVRTQLEQAMGAGKEVIVAAHPVVLAGRARLGWWERDLASGRVVGVMDDGRHGAMGEYAKELELEGLNDDMGLVVGAIVGATSTEVLIASGVLELGTVTEELIADIEKKIDTLKCLSCPKVEDKAEVEIKTGISCWDIGDKTKVSKGIKAEAKFNFCEKYADGLSCGSSMVLSGYKHSPLLKPVDADAKPAFNIGCVDMLKPSKSH